MVIAYIGLPMYGPNRGTNGGVSAVLCMPRTCVPASAMSVPDDWSTPPTDTRAVIVIVWLKAVDSNGGGDGCGGGGDGHGDGDGDGGGAGDGGGGDGKGDSGGGGDSTVPGGYRGEGGGEAGGGSIRLQVMDCVLRTDRLSPHAAR